MGYRVQESYARIIGEQDLEGFEALVKIRPVTRGYYEGLISKRDDEAFNQFLDDIVKEWNYEDDNGPVPPCKESRNRVDVTLLSALFSGWIRAMVVPPLAPNVRHEPGSTLTQEAPQVG